MTKLSIIVPVYNSQLYLKELFDSILVSNKKFELIVVNDGSTDNSLNICLEYEKFDKRIVVINKNNGGVSSARNAGIKAATGDYIMFVDSDDTLSKNWDEIFDYIGDADIYYFNVNCPKNINKTQLISNIVGLGEERLYLAGPVSKVYKKKIFSKKNILFDTNIINGEDMIFNLELALLSEKYEIINFQFYNYRQVFGQSTKKFNDKILDSDLFFHKKLDYILHKYDVDEKLIDTIENFCLYNAIILIFNRISYIQNYKTAKKYYSFLENSIYKSVIINNYKKSFIFRIFKIKKYRMIFIYYKLKNYLIIRYKKIRFKGFTKI